ncbi:FtsH protease activity modulator HflK [Rhodoblastus sp.]|uniref:FtsH protease activity modulator HflK n=1 Tax=Rhodoblastus sp. TaxID=1962975 RepID=UPI003F95C827
MPWSKPGGEEPPKPEGNDPSDGKRENGRGPWGSSGQGGSNNGKPWGGPGGGSPFGGSPFGGGPGKPPDLEAWVRKAQEKLSNLTSGDFSPRVLLLIGAAVCALWLASGFYTIDPNQIGLNLVFGRYVGKTLPGLNYNWPEPVGEVLKLDVTDRNSIDIGAIGRADEPGAIEVPEESLMLTGDENIADLKFRVIWQIDPAHPEFFAFNIKNQAETIKAVAESVMRDIVGHTQIQPLLTVARKVIEPEAQKAIQKVLDSYGAGVEILQVQLLSVDPPPTVIAAFRDVTAAQQDQSRFVNEAQGEANAIVPNARGEAARILNAAEAYRAQTVAEARGQTARYLKVFDEYQKAPAVTRERLYLETMERVLGGGDKIILDKDSATTSLLPLAPFATESKPAPGGNP